ncbi:hypothetical protein ACFV7Q_09485 [Streptomyces sp. NPDC059851]|uniref:hypothetical protein n=1 Tax=Streptomyces sp. NPDC059851 TaxID=3346971 RepID=UPI00365D0B3E
MATPQENAAWIALAGVLVTGALALRSSHRQRADQLVTAALSHMGGGTQERSAGVAALRAFRGPIGRGWFGRTRRPRLFWRLDWKRYAPAVREQLFRQLVYVLTHGRQRFHAHEVENAMAMIEWLLDDELLEFCESGKRVRLAEAIDAYVKASNKYTRGSALRLWRKKRAVPGNPSLARFRAESREWTDKLRKPAPERPWRSRLWFGRAPQGRGELCGRPAAGPQAAAGPSQRLPRSG